jgi:hypothetical protein
VYLHDYIPDKENGDRMIRSHRFGYRAIQLHKRAVNLPYLIQEREPWWEKLVNRLLVEAGGMLCFM